MKAVAAPPPPPPPPNFFVRCLQDSWCCSSPLACNCSAVCFAAGDWDELEPDAFPAWGWCLSNQLQCEYAARRQGLCESIISGILKAKISIYSKQTQQSVRFTGCYFAWLILDEINAAEGGVVCAYMHVCVCVCARQGIEQDVCKSSSSSSIIDGSVYLTSSNAWLVSVNHFSLPCSCQTGLKKCLAWSLAQYWSSASLA